jgi:hypothetical protein
MPVGVSVSNETLAAILQLPWPWPPLSATDFPSTGPWNIFASVPGIKGDRVSSVSKFNTIFRTHSQ